MEAGDVGGGGERGGVTSVKGPLKVRGDCSVSVWMVPASTDTEVGLPSYVLYQIPP